MNAIEIRNLRMSFKDKLALNDLSMTVPMGSIYGFIGENGSGKSTTEKLICGLTKESGGSIRLFDKPNSDKDVRAHVSCLIEAPGCYPNMSVWNNLMLQATNLNLKHPKEEVRKVLSLVRMEGAASNKFRNCSLGMKQRIGIAMALPGNPYLLILDEPINGLDADGMRIMRDILTDLSHNHNVTILISSHILGELEKIATHYGIIRSGHMIKEMTAEELNQDCPTYVEIEVADLNQTKTVLEQKYKKVRLVDEKLRVYDDVTNEDVVSYLYENHIGIKALRKNKINLEEYYIDLMNQGKEGR